MDLYRPSPRAVCEDRCGLHRVPKAWCTCSGRGLYRRVSVLVLLESWRGVGGVIFRRHGRAFRLALRLSFLLDFFASVGFV